MLKQEKARHHSELEFFDFVFFALFHVFQEF